MSALGHATDLLFKQSELFIIGTTFASEIGYEMPERHRMLKEIEGHCDLVEKSAENQIRLTMGDKLAWEMYPSFLRFIYGSLMDRLPKRTVQ